MDAKKLDVIRKLLAKAERAGTEAEAETYNAKARDLIIAYGIDEALLANADEVRDEIGAQRISLTDPYSAQKARLLGWVAAALGARWIMHGARGGKVAAVTIFGFTSDLERIELLFTSLQMQATGQLVRVRPPATQYVWERESVAAYRRSWLQGFAAQVHQRLVEAQSAAVAARDEAADAGTPGTALVLVDRKAQVDAAYEQQWGHLTGRARRQNLTGSGFAAGAEAGLRADIGGKRIGDRRVAIG
jgi:hypothetical protein